MSFSSSTIAISRFSTIGTIYGKEGPEASEKSVSSAVGRVNAQEDGWVDTGADTEEDTREVAPGVTGGDEGEDAQEVDGEDVPGVHEEVDGVVDGLDGWEVGEGDAGGVARDDAEDDVGEDS
jgi:hypothetical protein